MSRVGFDGVSDQANTSDGFASGVGAQNNIAGIDFGLDVGDDGVVDMYGALPTVNYYIADESLLGYVLQEDDSKIILESS